MGAPELPSDLGEDKLTEQIVQHPPIPIDDSENEDGMDIYNGYQPLGDNEFFQGRNINLIDDDDDDDDDDDNEEEDGNMETSISHAEAEELRTDTNLPIVESADVEIERQVWSEPRPQELQIELDNTKTEQILNVMANITLPANITVPDWATNVPEERWKEELLQRIRQRKEEQTNSTELQKEKNETTQ